jgi:hypothetical protein
MKSKIVGWAVSVFRVVKNSMAEPVLDNYKFCPVCGVAQSSNPSWEKYQQGGKDCSHWMLGNEPESYCSRCGIPRPAEDSKCRNCEQLFWNSSFDERGENYFIRKTDSGYELIVWNSRSGITVEDLDPYNRVFQGDFTDLESAKIKLNELEKNMADLESAEIKLSELEIKAKIKISELEKKLYKER